MLKVADRDMERSSFGFSPLLMVGRGGVNARPRRKQGLLFHVIDQIQNRSVPYMPRPYIIDVDFVLRLDVSDVDAHIFDYLTE